MMQFIPEQLLQGVLIGAISVISGLAAATGLGAAIGALSAWLGWVDTAGTAFDARKFAKGVVVGAIAGIGIVALEFNALQTALETDPSGVEFFKLIVVVAIGIIGVDVTTSKVGGLINTFFGPKPTTPTA